MQPQQHHVDPRPKRRALRTLQGAGLAILEQLEVAVRGRRERHGSGLVAQGIEVAVLLHVQQGSAGVPRAVFRDVDGHRRVPVAVERRRGLERRDDRHLVLGRHAAKDDADV